MHAWRLKTDRRWGQVDCFAYAPSTRGTGTLSHNTHGGWSWLRSNSWWCGASNSTQAMDLRTSPTVYSNGVQAAGDLLVAPTDEMEGLVHSALAKLPQPVSPDEAQRKPPPLLQPELLKWRHRKPSKLQELEPITQRSQELHFGQQWSQRLLAHFSPFAEHIPHIKKKASKRNWRTPPSDHCGRLRFPPRKWSGPWKRVLPAWTYRTWRLQV